MKKTILSLAILGSFSAFGQASDISTAVIAFDRRNDVEEARKFIDKAGEAIAANPAAVSPKDLGKYYYYKGRIYNQQATPEGAPVNMELLATARQAYMDCITTEKAAGKPKFSDKAEAALYAVGVQYYNQGVVLSGEDKKGSMEAFLLAFETKKFEGMAQPQFDSTALYNAAIMAEQANELNKAVEINKQLLAMGYTGRSFTAKNIANDQPVGFPNKASMEKAVAQGLAKDPQISEPVTKQLYLALLRVYQTQGNKDDFKTVLAEARAKFPDDETLIRLELQGYLDNKEYDKAMGSLDLAISKEPENKVYYYIKGFIQQNEMKQKDAARISYAKALELDPQYHDALYMTGLTFVEEANAITEEMNKLDLRQAKKYDELKAKQQAKFNDALPYFEKAEQIKPDDLDTLRALKEVYYRTGNQAKALEMTKRINAAQP
jgi:Tfp pilus assembly protein PilF